MTGTLADAKRLMEGPLGLELARISGRYVAPMHWRSALRDQSGAAPSTGTTFFIEQRGTFIGVTAGHVFDAFAEEMEQGGACGIGIGACRIDLRSRLIARGKVTDIATYRVSHAEVLEAGVVPYSGAWPPDPPAIGQGLRFAGFPGTDTRSLGNDQFEVGLCTGAGVTDSVSDRDVSCVVRREDMMRIEGLALPEDNFDFAGMSGGMVLALVPQPILSWRLVGVIYESSIQFEIIKAARADCIRED
jgi:hypothetical protein